MADPATLTGTVTKVRDGDTIEVGRIPIRLNGVSAPEMNEPLGPQSKNFMTDLVMGKRVRCELDGSKTHDRFVGICYLDEQDSDDKWHDGNNECRICNGRILQ